MSAYRHQVIDQIARVCYTVNRAYCLSINDNTQPVAWEHAEETSRESARKGVIFALGNPGATPEKQHEAWLADKKAQGFVYGPVKDLTAKVHPCMVPYDQLPQEQRVKDELFLAVVRSMEDMLAPHTLGW